MFQENIKGTKLKMRNLYTEEIDVVDLYVCRPEKRKRVCFFLPALYHSRSRSFVGNNSLFPVFQERRRQAVEEMLRVLKPGGQGLIYVWALEQEKDKIKSNYLKDTRIKRKDCLKSREKQLLLKEKGIVTEPNFDDNDSVPNQSMPSVSDIGSLTAEFGQLNCHDNDSTPAEGNSNMAGSAGLSEGKFSQFTPDSVTLSESSMAGSGPRGSTEALGQSEIRNPQKTDQRLAVHVNRTHFETQDLLVPWHSKPKQKSGDQEDTAGNEEKVVHRFYHVFQQGELEELCQTFDSLEMVENYYDKGNWCVVFRKQ